VGRAPAIEPRLFHVLAGSLFGIVVERLLAEVGEATGASETLGRAPASSPAQFDSSPRLERSPSIFLLAPPCAKEAA
jgi:hypothetical protein